MKQLLLFSILVSFNSFADNHIEDVLNETSLNYASRVVKFEETIWDDDRIFVPTFTDPNQWKGLSILEENLKNWASELILDAGLKTKAIAEMRKDLLFLYKLEAQHEGEPFDNEWIDYCNNLTPFELGVGMSIFALNGHLLVMQVYVEGKERDNYTQANNSLYYTELQYFDLKTGNKIDPATLFNPSKTKELLKIVKKKIPKEALEHMSAPEYFLDQPVFHGASFFLMLAGGSSGESESAYTFHARFALEEIQPFLKKDGGFAPYISLKEELPSTPTRLDLIRFEAERSWYKKDFLALTNEELLIEENVNHGIHSASYYIDRIGTDHLILYGEYDRNGRITMKVNYEYSSTDTRDSLLYFYHSNGNLSRIDYYDTQWDDDTTYCNMSYHYSEEGNITSIIITDDDWSDFIDYFYEAHINIRYFKDKAIFDGYMTSPMGTGLIDWERGPFDLWEGFEIERYDRGKTEFITPRNIKNNKLFEEIIYLKRDTISLDLNLENNRVVSGKFSTKKHTSEITVSYDENGKPLSFIQINKPSNRISSYTVDRDAFGKVISYKTDARVYKIVYDNSNP